MPVTILGHLRMILEHRISIRFNLDSNVSKLDMRWLGMIYPTSTSCLNPRIHKRRFWRILSAFTLCLSPWMHICRVWRILPAFTLCLNPEVHIREDQCQPSRLTDGFCRRQRVRDTQRLLLLLLPVLLSCCRRFYFPLCSHKVTDRRSILASLAHFDTGPGTVS